MNQRIASRIANSERMEDIVVGTLLELRNVARARASHSCFTEAELDALFDVGARHFAQGDWEDALGMFGLVSMFRPVEPSCLCAQAKCMKMMKDFNGASDLFMLAWKLDPDAPEPAMHAVECLLHAHKKSCAIALLETLMSSHQLPWADPDLQRKAEAWMSFLAPEKKDD